VNNNKKKLYNLSKGRSFQELFQSVNNNKKKLKKNEEYMNRIELIQDFEFKVAATNLKLSDDGSHLFTAGVYTPRLKIYDLNEMTLKVERGIDSEIRKICPISEDFTKCALLLDDRNIEIHAQYGKHFSIRIPKFGRDMVYNKYNSEILSCGTGNEIYRLNLQEGSFLEPLKSEMNGINSIRVNPYLNILGVCGEEGKIEIWDVRSKSKVAHLPISHSANYLSYLSNVNKNFNMNSVENTCLEFNNFSLAVGNKLGTTNLFDLRYASPLFSIKHSYNKPIHKIQFHNNSESLITVCKKQIKISNSKVGKAISNIEGDTNFNDFEVYQGSGMFFTANESPKMNIFFAPQLGPAPKWCSFLEKITEELEENNDTTLSEDKKFLDYKNLEELSCTNLVGTKFLTPYMHGYFMDMKTYKKLKALAEPFNYEKYLEEQKQLKIKRIFDNRIIISNTQNRNKSDNKNIILNEDKEIKVNKQLAEENPIIVQDNRFTKLLTNNDYKIDYTSSTYKNSKFKEKGLLFDNSNNKNLRNLIENDEDYQLSGNINKQDGENQKSKSQFQEKDTIVNRNILDLNDKLNRKKHQSQLFLGNKYKSKFESKEEYENKVKNIVREDVHTLEAFIKHEERSQSIKNSKKNKKAQLQVNKEGRRLLFNGRGKK